MDAPDCSAWLYICCNCGSYSDCTALGRLHVRCLACNRVMLGCSICRRDWSHWNQAYCGGNHLRDSVVAVHSSLRQFYTPSTCGIKCWEVPGTINGVPVNALPDWGSSVNAISEEFARRHGIEVEPAAKISITLPGGNAAESTGLAVGQFKFRGESIVYRRNFRVLKKCVYDVVLGREFLDQTKTLTKYTHRIIDRFRPCAQKGSRLFLLDEAPRDRIRCSVNGCAASAFPDTGSDLMLVSGDFARRNNFTIHRGQRYQRSIELIDGSIIRTDGMVLNAEMEFDAPPMSSPRELDYDRYLEYANGLATLTSKGGGGRAAATKTTFVCDLHVIEDLPCDIILSSEFIFDNQVFSRFNHLFHSEASPAPACLLQDCDTPRKMSLNDCMLFMRMKLAKGSWFPWRRPGQRQESPVDDNSVILRQLDRRWEELWDAEELRRNQMQLWIATLPEPQKSNE